jgi:hypothetical protein
MRQQQLGTSSQEMDLHSQCVPEPKGVLATPKDVRGLVDVGFGSPDMLCSHALSSPGPHQF